ncbi:hypothetical protein DICSQDRAFT_57253 [Dichomitus squalens LYAD-421 SS1]|uniref:uncharacterized protein n=1 Tax=Dichomitus squalens (strain LYAD-421) TaxID=732165 RepID=UPI0004413B3D|nr:uncharacterized protein DICSQDRAFT_57253 [Dichomitus squalens LYAD-421 SS1]EJF62764.1 hypothetical protein DICSQDRAFT_57253 [Dichomitus squalens LYAD-421 SS1]
MDETGTRETLPPARGEHDTDSPGRLDGEANRPEGASNSISTATADRDKPEQHDTDSPGRSNREASGSNGPGGAPNLNPSATADRDEPEQHADEARKDANEGDGDAQGSQTSPLPSPTFDIATFVPGLYRVLDLIFERGSGGLVDKIIIEQESLGRLINFLRPNAYASITKVDFSALDQIQVKPVGLYGSKSAIVDFLRHKGIVDEEIASAMLQPTDSSVDPTRPELRSGMYIHLREGEEVMHVIYWPEDTTWDDDCLPSVSRNRITFMRYLNKICDQVICFMSDEHANAIIWRGDDPDSDQESLDDEDADRLFTFEVSKTNEQEEGVTVRPGFEVSGMGSHQKRIQADSCQLPTPILSASNSENASTLSDVLRPRLMRGEMAQGILTAQYVAEQQRVNHLRESVSEQRLKDLLQKKVIRLRETLSCQALEILFKAKYSFDPTLHDAITRYRSSVADVKRSMAETRKKELDAMLKRIDEDSGQLAASIKESLSSQVLQKFPYVSPSIINVPLPLDNGMDAFLLTHLCVAEPYLEDIRGLRTVYEGVGRLIDEVLAIQKLNGVTTDRYKTIKERILVLDYLLTADTGMSEKERADLVVSTLRDGYPKPWQSRAGWSRKVVGFMFGGTDSSTPRTIDVPEDVLDVDDQAFFSRLPSIVDRSPLLAEPAASATELAAQHFSTTIKKEAQDLSRRIRTIQRDTCKAQITRQSQIDEENQLEALRVDILATLRSSPESVHAKDVMTINDIEEEAQPCQYPTFYRVDTTRETYTEPQVRYTLHPLELREDDTHRMRENASHVPSPHVRASSTTSFILPVDTSIIYAHLLPQARCLLITRDRTGEGKVYLSSTMNLQAALDKRPSKELKRDKIGENFLLAYDENKRILAVCGLSNMGVNSRLQLHTFAFDETYTTLQGMGTPVNLSSWYDSDTVVIKHVEFVSGSEELLFVDDQCRARIFSLVTQQFRPATLQLLNRPSSIHSTPDGSCFFAIDEPTEDADTVAVRAFHWTSFDSPEGIKVTIPKRFLEGCVVTSLLSRENVYLLGIDHANSMLGSAAFTITRRMTAFTFKEKGGTASGRKEQTTVHNSLIDCHAAVWTRFPVVPAVRRDTVVSTLRERRSLVFVSKENPSSIEPHFSTLIEEFERMTHKPTGGELKNIQILALSHDTFFLDSSLVHASTFRAGEWLVELLCLIPIHIAITRDNRFVPLKDGVWSPDVERSLLGADVAKIVDSISFGWYESLFQSYMAKKPVKVVSSMGEQSVGKSFALNHLVDTSFAGSAMRTTEGVWMSVTPTDEALIVALDFEGVHSIERSAQEDTLLVLFNTAISNLVLFRNNFAMSRDIAGLFQSFQSSATVLDPDANPMLFQSTLVIIIKDVAPHDTNDIKKEFHMKFQQIVQAEQAKNFISRLHRNKLDIVPWPLMGQKQFYTLFRVIKKRLDQQAITHHGGAVFLQTMKTLMAKLKANDWGAMSQNLAAHRVHVLVSLLPNALAFGATEVVPDFEPLLDFDTASVIDMQDTTSRFYLGEGGPQGQPESCDEVLRGICESFDEDGTRFSQPEADWKQSLQTFLDHLVDIRVEHVRGWLNANTSKFGSTHSEVQQLFRTFDTAVIDLKSSVRMCSIQCGSCNLSCILGRHHEGQHSCRTDHRCVHVCEFKGADHGETEPCGLPAGHPGSHLCDVTAHLCGQPCKLSSKKGCQKECIKMADHTDGEHMCSATSHECGMPCSLATIRLHNGWVYNCEGRCRIPSDLPHNEHRCENTQCTIDCQLCKRLCSEHDHLHGLDSDAVHLCGQEHPCAALCQEGVCHVDTAPQSVEATFTGRHESFQYTKVCPLMKRLPCVIPIAAGEVKHGGKHRHDMGPNPFHYCQEQCPDCGYFCTLPLGHPQQEHETSHGSMSRTKWAVDGVDGTVLEVNGRKFGSNDDGAPMLCSMYCRSMGRHVHVDWCRADDPSKCDGPEHEHIKALMLPKRNKAKDWITHSLYWKRTDPYSQEDQAEFARCDRMCGGPEHDSMTHAGAKVSYCTLPILHRRQPLDQVPANGLGYVSNDGHAFSCRNPAVLRQAFHVIFAIDRSGSMSAGDRRPLDNTPTTQLIRRSHNNRLGAAYSSLHGFWEARHRAVAVNGGNARRDAYSVILFDHSVTTVVTHDFNSSPTELLNAVLRYRTDGGTNFTLAIETARACMERHWSTERVPVVIFLSDGECGIADETMQDLCRRSIALGKPLSFHAVSFGPNSGIMQRMAQIARDVESGAPQDPLNPHAGVPSSYNQALDTVRLAETFLGIAESLTKPRGALFRG